MAALVDTNVLVYRFDPRFPIKQRRAIDVLRAGIETDTIRVPHQAIVEFFAAVTGPLSGRRSLLTIDEARRETEELLNQFVILYPIADVIRSAIRAQATYQLSWFDAHMWAYAESYGLEEILSENFEHGRYYGTVRAVNPFV